MARIWILLVSAVICLGGCVSGSRTSEKHLYPPIPTERSPAALADEVAQHLGEGYSYTMHGDYVAITYQSPDMEGSEPVTTLHDKIWLVRRGQQVEIWGGIDGFPPEKVDFY